MNNTLDTVIIVVDEEPFCIWEMELAERNKEFLEGIDVGYWDYILNTNFNSDDEKRASIALRSAFHHSLETMFSLLGGFLQAPDCVYAWVAKCSNVQLRSVIRKITQQNSTLFTRFHIQQISWKRISELVFH